MTRPRTPLATSALVALTMSLASAVPAAAQMPDPEKADVVLHTDRTAYEAGSTARVAALVTIEPGWHVNSHEPTFDYLIPTSLDVELPAGWPEEKVQYPKAEMETFAFADQPLAVYSGDNVQIVAELQVPKGTPEGEVPLQASLHYQACDNTQCLPPVTTKAQVTLRVSEDGAATAGGAASGTGTAKSGQAGSGMSLMLLLGFVGGLILNAMPCVLPVLSLKIFGLVRSAGHGRSEVVRATLATSAGILVSFWALALAAAGARAAGSAVGWGVQFQRPGFVAFLAVIVVLFCLNLWGLFEIQLPWRLAQLGGTGAREGTAGHFFSGLFATLMATPCSAPFLGPALGFALGQETLVIFAMFTAVALGMSLPYLLIAAAPGIARFLPRPGPWMETVRGLMGFLLAGAAVWLFYVLSAQVSPERVAGIKLALLGLALFTWLRHRGLAGRAFRHAAAAGMVATVAVALFLAAGGSAAATSTHAGERMAEKTPGLIAWVPFDRARAESLAAGGKMVFVDVTADWCFTCKFNERLVLETPEVANAFQEHGVIPMKADWTNRDDAITRFLAEHGRYGIPFYLLYLPGGEPHVFSEIPTKDGLVEVVRNSGRPQRIAAR